MFRKSAREGNPRDTILNPAENNNQGIAEKVGQILGLGVLDVGKRFKNEGFDLKGTYEWSDRVAVTFVKEGIQIVVVFDNKRNEALIVEGRQDHSSRVFRR